MFNVRVVEKVSQPFTVTSTNRTPQQVHVDFISKSCFQVNPRSAQLTATAPNFCHSKTVSNLSSNANLDMTPVIRNQKSSMSAIRKNQPSMGVEVKVLKSNKNNKTSMSNWSSQNFQRESNECAKSDNVDCFYDK